MESEVPGNPLNPEPPSAGTEELPNLTDIPPKPKTLKELFDFYQEWVKLLYSAIQTDNVLPQEVLFELNAALDHISRHWIYEEEEETSIEKAYSHLKRSCLDIFKLKAKETFDQWKELRRTHIELIDNGEFKRKAIQTISEIKRQAKEARHMEGDRRDDKKVIQAFDLWAPVYLKCVEFERDFYLNEHIEWARRKHLKGNLLKIGGGIVLGIISSLCAQWIWRLFT